MKLFHLSILFSLVILPSLYLLAICCFSQSNFMEKQQTKACIYLLVGFLGAGKTTFIKRLLQLPVSQKFAVIQNQFAEEMGIEAPLITNSQGTPFRNFMELPNGCICCSAKNDLLAAIEYLVNVSGIASIVVETNGVADPANVRYCVTESIKQFWLDDNMKIPVKLHSIISIVPCHRIELIEKEELFRRQLIFSNKAVLNFLDVCSPQQK